MIEDNHLHKDNVGGSEAEDEVGSEPSNSARPSLHVRPSMVPAHTPPLRESVRATLSPHTPTSRGISGSRLSVDSPRSSTDIGFKRRSFDVSPARASSESGTRSQTFPRRDDRSPISTKGQDTQDSTSSPRTESQYPETDSSANIQSLEDSNASASQILNRSDVFPGPTIHPMRSVSDSSVDHLRRASEDTARSRDHRQKSSRDRSTSRRARNLLRKQPPAPMRATSSINAAASGEPSSQVPSWAVQDLMRAGSYPLQRASGLAGFLRDRSKKMSNLLATESMGYYEKVSDMWVGGARHYNSARELAPEDDIRDEDDDKDAAMAAKRFREHFSLPETEQLIASYFTYMHRVLPLYGKIYISNKHLCYRSLLPGTRTKLVLPLKDIEAANKEKGYRLGYCALVVVIRGHEEIFFDFRSPGNRDDCAITLILTMEGARKNLQGSTLLTPEEKVAADIAKAEYDALHQARQTDCSEKDSPLNRPVTESGELSPLETPISTSRISQNPSAVRRYPRLHHQLQTHRIAAHHVSDDWVSRRCATLYCALQRFDRGWS
jgi:sterol 3beta-glucosyltransferase